MNTLIYDEYCISCGGLKGCREGINKYVEKYCGCFTSPIITQTPNFPNISDNLLKEALAQRLYNNLKNCKNSTEIAEELESFFKVEIIKD